MEGDRKPDVNQDVKSGGASEEPINLKVVGADGAEIHFKIKRSTAMRKVMEAYCQRQGQRLDGVRFLFDGERIQPDQTAADIDLADGDSIDVMIEQTGGF